MSRTGFIIISFGFFLLPSVAGQDFFDIPSTTWRGKWFPNSPGYLVDSNPTTEYFSESGASTTEEESENDLTIQDLQDKHHGIKMGIPLKDCDDAKTNLTVDWDENPINYTCYEDKSEYKSNHKIHPQLTSETIPKHYHAPHYCMGGAIRYNKPIPTYGGHRPLWPKYGEYRFVPIQRWLHSVEHGAIVYLYHPCANAEEVDKLRKVVTGCLRRHIITPYTLVSKERPLVLVAWGYRLEMSKVDEKIVRSFIKKAAKKGPEHLSRDGNFKMGLIRKADTVSDFDDSVLCPDLNDNSFEE